MFYNKYLISLFIINALYLHVPKAYGQIYNLFSIRTTCLGYATDNKTTLSVSPRYSIGNSHIQADVTIEIPMNTLQTGDEWAGTKLKKSEQIDINRYVAKFRFKNQPNDGALGFTILAVNHYFMNVEYRYQNVFDDVTSQITLKTTTTGTGIFQFWATGSSWLRLVGYEILPLTDFENFAVWLEFKTLLPNDIKFGLVSELITPAPEFSNYFIGAYLEYSFIW